MTTKSLPSELVVLVLLALVPLPPPPEHRAPCPTDRSAVVRNIVTKKWLPILKQHGLSLPLECPFHPMRDIFWPRQLAKIRHRPSQWSCGLCGKSFYSESFLDHHFESRHAKHLNMAEDAVCLADFCDIMRCAVWEAAAAKGSPVGGANTDLEVWRDSSSALMVSGGAHSATAIQAVPPAVAVTRGGGGMAHYSFNSAQAKSDKSKQQRVTAGSNCATNTRTKRGSSGAGSRDGENGTAEQGASCTSREERLSLQMQRFKADCRPETLQPLQARCESIVWDCLAGLITNLSTAEFNFIEGEMSRAVCWYLTCDRYWENAPLHERRRFPWVVLLALVTGLALVICLCYYLIWLMCDWDEHGAAREISMSQPASPAMHTRGAMHYAEDPDYYTEALQAAAAAAPGEHYIYVTYPPELKRRLMESCYNRTTRL